MVGRNYVKCIYVNMRAVVVSGGLAFLTPLTYLYEDSVSSAAHDSTHTGVHQLLRKR